MNRHGKLVFAFLVLSMSTVYTETVQLRPYNDPARVLLTACLFSAVEYSQAARILAIVPTASYSHQIPFRPLWKSLISRGHELVLVTSNPMPDVNSTRITQINIGRSYDTIRAYDFVQKRFEESWLQMAPSVWDLINQFVLNVFENPQVQKLYAADSNETFDLVMAENAYGLGMFALAHRFNAPSIGLGSLPWTSEIHHIFGSPVLPSHPSSWEMETKVGFNLSFWQRLRNFVYLWFHLYKVHQYYIPKQQVTAEKYLGSGIPSITDIYKNVSLFFVNQAETMAFARPRMPNVILFDSLHTHRDTPPMPKELKSFLDQATNGFVYFSLGTNANSSALSEEIQEAFCEVFAKLPYKVLWKYEKELPGKPENIYTAAWLPQQSILAHPNIKLFIYQGGMQSSEEAVYYGVPLVGIPILADQDYNVHKLVSVGVARRLEITSMTKKDIEDAVLDVLTDKGYKERMVQLMNVSKDRPYNPIDNLVWWTEFVIRHKGAPHLRTSIVGEPWYQKYDMDILVFLAIVTFVTSICVLSLVYNFFTTIFKYRINSSMNEKRKVS